MFNNNFKLDIQNGEVENPFFLSSVKIWEEKQLLSVESKYLDLLDRKKAIIDKAFPIEEYNVHIIDSEYSIQYIEPEYLVDKLELTEEDTKILSNSDIRDLILYYVDKGLLTDQQYQLVFSIIKYFDVSSCGLLYKKEGVDNNVDTKLEENTEDERYKYYKNLFGLPFSTFFKEVTRFAKVNDMDLDVVKKELDNFAIKEQIDAGYVNEDLPNKYLPLVARNSFVDPDGNPFTPSIWQSYFMYHEPEKRMNMVVTSRQAGKFGGTKRQLYRLVDGTFRRMNELNVGDKLLASDKKSDVTIQSITKTYEPVLKIKLKNGLNLYTTKHHDVVTHKNYIDGKFEGDYVSAKDLNGDEFIPTMHNIGIEGESIDLNLAKLFGYWLGDGNRTLNNSKVIKITVGKNQDYLNKLIKYAANLGLKYRTYSAPSKPEMIDLYIYDFIPIFRKRYGDNFVDKFHFKSINRAIPSEVFGWNKEAKWALLEGLFGSDGYLDNKHSSSSVCMEYVTMSDDLAEDIMILLSDVGVIAKVKDKKIYSTNFNKSKDYSNAIHINNRKAVIDLIEHCDLSHMHNYKTFTSKLEKQKQILSNSKNSVIPLDAVKEIPYTYTDLKEIGNRKPRYNFQRWKCKDLGIEHWNEYQWAQIESIEEIESEEVYHIEVDKDHLLWVGAILTHNSVASSIVGLLALLSKKRGDILFVVPSEEFIYQPMQYFEKFSEKFKQNGLIKVKKSENIVECPITGNTLKFASSLSKSGGRSQSAPFIIFDEASYIKDEVFERALPIFLGRGGKFYAFSTINWKQRNDNSEWFFKWSKWIELGKRYDIGGGNKLDLSDIGNVYRVTVDEIEWKDPMETQLLKMSLKDKPEKYFAELYATMPSSEGLFTTEGFWLAPELYQNKYYSPKNQFIIGWDPAKLQDTGGLIVMDATHGVVIEEIPLNKVNYMKQIEIVQGLISQYNNAQLVFDRTRDETTYEVLLEKGVRPISIKYTAGGEVKRDNKDWWSYNVPKKTLVDTFEMMVEKNKLYALGNLNLLQEEIHNFKAIKTAAGNTKYEAQTGTDDTINATFVAAFYYNMIQKNNARFIAQQRNKPVNEERLRMMELQKNRKSNPRYRKFIY